MEIMAVGLKGVQERCSRRWDKVHEERKAAESIDRKLREKADELRTWYSQ